MMAAGQSDAHARAVELASLAARVCPELCQEEPQRAIEFAEALLEAAHVAVDPDRDFHELRELSEKRDAELEPYRSFEHGVKFITSETRFDRAMPWFRKFIRSRCDSDKICDKAVATARAKGFGTFQLESLNAQFAEWKARDKSQTARTSRAKRASKEQAMNKTRTKKSPVRRKLN